MEIRRVALIFDHRVRPETTGVYVRRALGQLVEIEHVLPDELGRLPGKAFDLYLIVDDGLDYVLPVDLHPSAYWAIDTHLEFDRCLTRSRTVDMVFAAQRDGAERLRRAGLHADWLPLACDPEIHCKHEVPKQHDFAFVGNVFPGPRSELLYLLRHRFPVSYVGNRYFEELAETYSAARLAFNRSLRNDVNMRVFEATACGTMLLTNNLPDNGQDELFRPGVHLETYRDADELLDKALYYLKHEETRERIAAAGMSEAQTRHTYGHRMESLLASVGNTLAHRTFAPATQLSPKKVSLDPSYFAHARLELLELIPNTAKRVLDVGCGAGRLGEALKSRQEVEVVGIELNEIAAHLAETRLDRVLVGDAERVETDWPASHFDAIVFGDILEHLREPQQFLRRAQSWLHPNGTLIASIPNVRNHTVVNALLEGNWTYESAGLLDRDHVRFFTRREIEKLFFRAGLAIEQLSIVPGPGYEAWHDKGRLGSVRVGRLHIGGLTPEQAEEFYAYQYLVKAVPTVSHDFGLTSIIILTHNQLPYTRECLDSIRLRTDDRFELIVVDNASTDGTVEYLRSLPDITLVENASNRGFAAACNQGLAIAQGRQILLLNNDTVVTTGWLKRLLDVLRRDSTIGLVGPCSNHAGSQQQIDVSYDDQASLDGFAWDWGKAHEGLVEDTDRLIGFCLLIRRKVVEEIGVLDEQFGIGCYEDDDYCLRAIRAGWRAVIARDAFVHHYGSRTFIHSGIDHAAVMRKNEEKFRAKWAAKTTESAVPNSSALVPATQASVSPPQYLIESSPGGGLLLSHKQIRLSLCMIVRDNAHTIRPCLESIRPWVDEMVVVDTGSVDETPRIVQEYGARLFHFPWCDDFAAARNESLKHARGEWLFWMDSDDTIEADCGRQLRVLAHGQHDPSVLGYVVQVHCPGAGEDGAFDVTAVDHVKLIRNRPDIRFDGRIHEQLLPAIRRADGEVAWTDLYVVHSGSDHSTAGRDRKIERDLRLLRLELAERPEHTFTLFNLGMTCADCDRFDEAVEYLKRSIRASGPGESHLRKAYALLAYAQMQLERRDEADATLKEGRQLFPDDAELLFRQGVLLHEMGRLEEAARAYEAVLRNTESRHFSSLDRGITGFKARQNLAIVLAEMGRIADAETQWRLIVTEVPSYRPGWRGLGDVLIHQGDRDQALEVVERLSSEPDLEAEAWLLAGRIANADQDLDGARRAFESALTIRPSDTEIHHALCQLLFDSGDLPAAERGLLELARINPDDASTHHNLGSLYLRQKRYPEAVDAYRTSLMHRAKSAPTQLQLGYALKESGRREEAAAAWQETLRLDPGNLEARAELEQVGVQGSSAIALPPRLWFPSS